MYDGALERSWMNGENRNLEPNILAVQETFTATFWSTPDLKGNFTVQGSPAKGTLSYTWVQQTERVQQKNAGGPTDSGLTGTQQTWVTSHVAWRHRQGNRAAPECQPDVSEIRVWLGQSTHTHTRERARAFISVRITRLVQKVIFSPYTS